MGDHQRRPIARDLSQGGLDILLGKAIEGQGRLVEDEYGRSLENGTGDRDALFFAARQI